jgi:hypothetical protein
VTAPVGDADAPVPLTVGDHTAVPARARLGSPSHPLAWAQPEDRQAV